MTPSEFTTWRRALFARLRLMLGPVRQPERDEEREVIRRVLRGS